MAGKYFVWVIFVVFLPCCSSA